MTAMVAVSVTEAAAVTDLLEKVQNKHRKQYERTRNADRAERKAKRHATPEVLRKRRIKAALQWRKSKLSARSNRALKSSLSKFDKDGIGIVDWSAYCKDNLTRKGKSIVAGLTARNAILTANGEATEPIDYTALGNGTVIAPPLPDTMGLTESTRTDKLYVNASVADGSTREAYVERLRDDKRDSAHWEFVAKREVIPRFVASNYSARVARIIRASALSKALSIVEKVFAKNTSDQFDHVLMREAELLAKLVIQYDGENVGNAAILADSHNFPSHPEMHLSGKVRVRSRPDLGNVNATLCLPEEAEPHYPANPPIRSVTDCTHPQPKTARAVDVVAEDDELPTPLHVGEPIIFQSDDGPIKRLARNQFRR